MTLFLAVGGICAFGLYKVAQGNQHRRDLRREKREVRAALTPYLQAEEDLRFSQARELSEQAERLIMQDPDWKPSTASYRTPGVFVPPAFNRFG